MSTPLKVLVIDDDSTTQKIVEKILRRDICLRYLDPQVSLAADGAQGLALFKTEKPNLVITDLLLPKLDGFKLLEAIRATPEGKNIPILVLTAVFRDRRTQIRLEREFNAVMCSKPFTPRQLAKQIASMVAPTHPEATAAHAGVANAANAAPPPISPAVPPAAQPGPAHTAVSAGPAAGCAGRQGTLADVSVARLLLDANTARFSGSLDLRRGKARKVIYLLSGQPIFVQSNQRGETLGQMLIKRGGITAEQHAQTLSLSAKASIKYGEALVRLGLMTEAQVMQELVSQTRAKIENCLSWRTGSFCIIEDRTIGQKVPRCTVDVVNAIFEGLRRHLDLDEAFHKLADKGALCLKLRPEFEGRREAFVAANGRTVLDSISRGRTVAEVIQAGGSPHEAVLQIESLLQCGLAELTTASRGAGKSQPMQSVVDGSVNLEHLATLAKRTESTQTPMPEPALSPENSSVINIADFATARPARHTTPVDPERARVALQLIQATYLGLHDANHYQILGVTPQSDLANIEVAYRIKRRQFDAAAFRDIELGDQRGRLEEIVAALDGAYAVLADASRRAEYDRSLKSRPAQRARDNALRAEELCRQGEDLLENDRFADAEVAFAKASQLDDQPEYRAFHALAYFMASGGSPQVAEEAMVEVLTALASDPGEVACYLVAAKISRSLGHVDEAMQHLQKLIKLEPSCQEAFDELEDILLEQDRVDTLEVEYRRTLHLLGNLDVEWATFLWQRLALLYRDQLHDPERARLACTAALRLKPNDSALRALLSELDREHPERWPDAVLGYRSLLRSDPEQSEPLHHLYRLHLTARRLDAAYQAACAAMLRGQATPEEKTFVEKHATGHFRKIESSLSARQWEGIRHPDDDEGLAMLLALLGPALDQRYPLRLADFGVDPNELVAATTLPPLLSDVVAYVAGLLEVPLLSVAVKTELGTDVQVLATDPPVLLIGDAALGNKEPFDFSFRLGRALAQLRPGRRLILGRPRRLLRNYLLAAVTSAIPKLKVPDVDGQVTRARTEVAKLAPQQQIQDAVLSLRERFEQLNLNHFARGVQRSAERAALLISGDLGVAARIVRGIDPESETDLIDFALGESFAELRATLGLAIH